MGNAQSRTVTGGPSVGATEVSDYIRRLVDAAPPLTARQRDVLADLLTPCPPIAAEKSAA